MGDWNKDIGHGWQVRDLFIGGVVTWWWRKQKKNKTTMEPDIDLQVNDNSEGQVVPLFWGRGKLSTNILWYGNLETVPVFAKAGGKGFMGGGKQSGFDYYVDVWHGLCKGPNVTLYNVYVEETEEDLSELGSYTFNDGNDGTYPTEPGSYASPMTPIAHIFLDRYYIGENVNTVPTLHFKIGRASSAPLSYVNETNGVNPAAIVYDLLVDEAGVPSGDIDLTSFNEASTYWHSKGYGLNIKITRQAQVREHIGRVLSFVDASLYVNRDGQYVLKAHRNTDTSVATFDTEDFLKFQFKRPTWDEVFTDFRGNFIDEDADFTERTVRIRNPAVRALTGHSKQRSVDLSAFRTADSASARLTEIMKQESYPAAAIKCTVGNEYDSVNLGDIVTVNHTGYDLSSAEFRVLSKKFEGIESNEITFELGQFLETLFDDEYSVGGTTDWTTPTYTPVPLAYERVVELPYTEMYGESPAYLCLGARVGQEDGFSVLYSPDGSDYTTQQTVDTFAQYGTLDENYTADTETIDDDIGILFTPYRNDPSFDSISRSALFSNLRFAILVNTSNDEYELVAFEDITPEGSSSYRLTGVIRGLLNTDVTTHYSANTEIWLVNLLNNVVTGITPTNFYMKFVPFSGTNEASAAACSAISVSGESLAAQPWPPTLIEVVKSGATNTVDVTPTTRTYIGAGAREGAAQTDQDPPSFEGGFQWYTSVDSTVNTETSYTFAVTQAGGFTLYVRSIVSGFTSDWKSVVVGAADDTYYGPAA